MRTARHTDDLLAIAGGQPVRQVPLPYGRQSIDEDDISAVVEVLRTDWITTGPRVIEFEEAFASYVGARHAVAFSSGTAGLHGAAFAAGLEPGDEAVTTPMTFAATANSVLYLGAKPVFADVHDDTLNIDPDEVARRITTRTKAILPVDYAGHPADLQQLLDLADRHGLAVIEDGCHALGAEYKGRPVGSISHMTVFSFHPVKHITTGEGGMVTTDDVGLADRLRMFRNHGITDDYVQRERRDSWFYEMRFLGGNFRITDIQCALGLSQLGKLPKFLNRRRQIAAAYDEALSEMAFVRPLDVRHDVSHAYHLYVVRLDVDALGASRETIFRALRAENIGVNVHYIPVHLHPYYREKLGTGPGLCPVAEAAYDCMISLPIFPLMSDCDVADVVKAIGKIGAIGSVCK